MPREDAYQLFLTVLELHGFTVVESANALTVIPAQLGREQSIGLTRRYIESDNLKPSQNLRKRFYSRGWM